MILNKKCYFIGVLMSCIITFSVPNLYSQKLDNNSFIEEIIENLIQDNEAEEYAFDTYYELFKHYAENPININKTSKSELAELQILSEVQLAAFFKYLEKEGSFISIFELQAIPSFDLNTIYKILPFIKTSGSVEDFHIPVKKLLFNGHKQLFFRYSQQFPLREAYKNETNSTSRFQGNPSKLYLRFKYNFTNKISYGFTAEKDAGETFFRGVNKNGFDFYSGHLFFKTNSIFKKIALGDYQLKLGQGLVFWSGFGTGKSSYTNKVKKAGSALKPYTSVDEYRFLRGGATEIKIGNLVCLPFLSIQQIDANIVYLDSTKSQIESLRIQNSGLHRNQGEIEDKNQVLELKTGAVLKYGQVDKSIAVNFLHTAYDHEIQSKKRADNQFSTIGRRFTNLSVDYNFLLGTFHFFGENALSFTQKEINRLGYGFLNGVLFSVDQKVDFSLVHRYYDKKFVSSIASDAFAESSTANNEHGIYWGTEIRPIKSLKINAYLDLFYFPWLRFQSKAPSYGRDFLSQINYNPNKALEVYFRYKNESKQRNTKIDLQNDYTLVNKRNENYFKDYFGENIIFETNDEGYRILKANQGISKDMLSNANFISNHVLQNFRFNVKYRLSKSWSFQTRVEFTLFNNPINGQKTGFLSFQDIRFKPFELPLSFNFRISYFDIQDYQARIYAYESDVLHQFSVPSFNNRGVRSYLNLRYRLVKGLDFWLRIAHTHFNNIEQISSGINTIRAKHQTELKAQIRIKF